MVNIISFLMKSMVKKYGLYGVMMGFFLIHLLFVQNHPAAVSKVIAQPAAVTDATKYVEKPDTSSDQMQTNRLASRPSTVNGNEVIYDVTGQAVTLELFNKMSASELESFKGIGQRTAQSIIEYRKQHGLFSSFDELTKIKGIGEKKLQHLLKIDRD